MMLKKQGHGHISVTLVANMIHQSKKCSVHEKQNMFSKREKYLAIERYSFIKCQDLYELATYFTDSLLGYGLLLMLK